MRGLPPYPMHGRAIIGVIALYALCLQVFLGALAPLPSSVSGDVICAEHGDAGAPSDGGLPCRHQACCTAVQALDPIGAPTLPFAAVAWPVPAPDRASWGAVALPGARAPPDQSVSPRGPPAL